MNNRLEYGGFIILALPYQLGDDNRWTLNIWIEIHTGDRVVSRPFSTLDTFETREEAVSHGFQFGRRIIDGSEPGLSVVDMT
jgi:hypothetical protein